MVQATYELHVRQQTTLTPRLQQSVKLLQMSTLEFRREMAEAFSNNPFLEEIEENTAHDESADPGRLKSDGCENLPGAPQSQEQLTAPLTDKTASVSDSNTTSQEEFENLGASYAGDYPASYNSHDSDVAQWARSEVGLLDSLHADLCGYHLTDRDRDLVEFIIQALDEDGYLRVPLDELALSREFDPPVALKEWETALKLVQQLATPGLAARNLAECLTLQLEALAPGTPGRELALRITAEQLERLGRHDYTGLARLLRCPEDEVRQACALIRGLDPKPGLQFTGADPSCYVVPDVIVRRMGKTWVAIANEAAVPRARLHESYVRLFREATCSDRSPMTQALQEARWLLRSIEQRCTTIQRVAQAIVARQQTFFEYGEIALRPLMLSEIAEELQLHESTISRATSNKYLATARGVYEFKHFFSRELAMNAGGTCSATAVRALIQEMIDEENPREPLSDVILAQKLAKEGIKVARRTVSKYRAQIKAPPAEIRRTQ